ncbi:hypothetical protein MYX64_05490 [Nitrospinae bacterium AH_259_B05_G02_I21]|nr:hypothetical protein [Nitrospinae bacterium AH_259_B05_G02_I21]MDA2932175.1 hypothetical protein [Nitrospinae bacterium AH-259-F20]
MSLVHGKAISAEKIERIVGRKFTPTDFASLCNAIAWASSGLRCGSLPSFTERVNDKDGGIDTEWQTVLPDDSDYISPLLGPGLNIFQYKKRDIFTQVRAKTISNVRASLKGAIKELQDRTGRRPDRYVFFTNIDLSHKQKASLRKNILEDYDQPKKVQIEIVGAGELAAFLNNLPHLRSTFFATSKFSTWEEAWLFHNRQRLYGANVQLIGRDQELADLRSFLDDPNIRVVILTGPHNMGKTRIALQGTEHRQNETVFTLDPRAMSVNDLLALESPGLETVVIVDDPEPELAELLINQVIARTSFKLLLSLPTAETLPTPTLGLDDRMQYMRLKPLSDAQSKELLKAKGVNLGFSLESWVIEQSGGNPGIILCAASLGMGLKKTAGTLSEEIAKAFEQKVLRDFGSEVIEILKLLSLLSHVGVKEAPSEELEVICTLFGNGLQPNTVLNALPHLRGEGIVEHRGSYTEVTPPLFANNLAESVLRGRSLELYALFAALSQAGRYRLIRRLRFLKGDEVASFWSELFGKNGLFGDLPSAITNGYLLRLVAGSVPEKASRLAEEGLKSMSREERLAIRGDERRELMWTVEQLLFRKKTCQSAIRCLALLAEAETENYGNNATGVFCECFHPLHPQLPLPLRDRLELLRELFSPEHSVDLRLIGISAIDSGLSRTGFVTHRESSGPEPLDTRPEMTRGDVWNYIEALVDLLMEVAQSEEQAIAEAAGKKLPHVLAEGAIQGRPETGISRFQTATDWILQNKVPIPISDFIDSLRFVKRVFCDHKDKDEESAAKFQECIDQIESLLILFDKDDVRIRLMRWAGKWTREDDEELEEGAEHKYRFQKELSVLAEEAVEDPAIITDDLLAWLCSEEATKAHVFFWWLGRVDSERTCLPKIEEIGAESQGMIAFAAYCGGWNQLEPQAVGKRLEELTKSHEVAVEAIIHATGYLEGDLASVKRVEKLIHENRVDPKVVENVLRARWINSLSPDEYLVFLRAIAGPELTNALEVMKSLGMWLHFKRSIEGELAEFAWECLEIAQDVSLNERYYCNRIASHLAHSDIERGFRLLEKLLLQPYESKCWEPIARHGRNEFWDVLTKTDRERAIRLVLSLALSNSFHRYSVTWALRGVINQEIDVEVLLAFALEDEQQAEQVCKQITTGQPGFWPLARKIIEKYPTSQKIQYSLACGVEKMGEVIVGPSSVHYENCRKEVETVLSDSSTPSAARPWLEQLESSFRAQSERELISEADEDVNELRRVVESPEAPERIWAVGTLLRLGKMDKIMNLLLRDELLTILPKLQLSEDQLEEIRKKIENWT